MEFKHADVGAHTGTLAILIGADDQLISDVRSMISAPVALAALSVDDWNAELSPWPAPGLRAGEQFAGCAQATVERLMAQLPEMRARAAVELGRAPECTLLVGYSLAGLCALWAATRVGAFEGAGSVSGSLWYDGFCEYIEQHALNARAVYLSLGSAEPRARNPRLARVGESTLYVRDTLARRGMHVEFEWNPGNHFANPPARIARCVDWLWSQCDVHG